MADSKGQKQRKASGSQVATSGDFLEEAALKGLLDEMYDNPNGPVKILTASQFWSHKVGTILGVPIFVDPLIPKDEVYVEYADGHRERMDNLIK